MQISRRVTNGLAWAGVALVVGVPTADAITARLMEPATSVAIVSQPVVMPSVPQVEPVEQADTAPVPAERIKRPANREASIEAVEDIDDFDEAVETAAAPAPEAVQSAAVAGPVDAFLSSGRPLPAYISGAAPASTDEATAPAQPTAQPSTPRVQQAEVPAEPSGTVDTAALAEPALTSVQPVRIPPVPAPLSQRPQPQVASIAPPSAISNPAIVIPDSIVTGTVSPASSAALPPAVVPNDGQLVTAQDLEDWESGPLSDFLARRQQAGQQGSTYYHEGDSGSSASFQTWPAQIEQPQFYVYPLR